MTSLGSGSGTTHSGKPGKFTGLGTVVLAIVFLVALVFAANHNDVLGWFIAIVALGWLVLSTFVYIGVHKAAVFGAEQVRKAQAQMAQYNTDAAGNADGTHLVQTGPDEATQVRDLKLDHSFKIIQVQVGVVNDYMGKDQAMVDRALETIQITAHNARGMMKTHDSGAEGAGHSAEGSGHSKGHGKGRGTDGTDGEEPISGVVIE